MKKVFICAALFCACAAFAVERVSLRICRTDGSERKETVELAKTDDGAMRLCVPVAKLKSDIVSIEVLADEARANAGDDGYWVLGDGRSGRFVREEGLLEERRSPMPLYGVKKGDSAFVAIVKGLKYEFKMVVKAQNGKYRIYPSFLINEIGFAPYEDLIIDFYTLKGGDANYSGMGRVYRKYQLERGEVTDRLEREDGVDLADDVLDHHVLVHRDVVVLLAQIRQ